MERLSEIEDQENLESDREKLRIVKELGRISFKDILSFENYNEQEELEEMFND